MHDSDDVANRGGRLLYVAGNGVSFRTTYDATIPVNTWHRGRSRSRSLGPEHDEPVDAHAAADAHALEAGPDAARGRGIVRI